MDRQKTLTALRQDNNGYDFIVIGGGATGIGIALEAAARGYKTVLFEKSDFTKSTSSKSTKLVHGGVRYLAQGDIALVREALRERGLLRENAPHLVKNQSFVIPAAGLWDEFLYTIGLTLYDLMAGSLSLGRSKRISKTKTLKRIATFKPDKLTAGIVYQDGQFDDSRLAINTLQTIHEIGGKVVNYTAVVGLHKDDNQMLNGVRVKDEVSGDEFSVFGKNVVNATGVFADEVMQMDNPDTKKTIAPSQGIHLILDRHFLPGNDAIMIPKTDDGRVLFAVPWHGKVVVGTTDTPIEHTSLEPRALEEEVEFVLNTAGSYLKKPPKRSDVLSVFAGLRPLAAPKGDGKKTKEISRSHKIFVSDSGLLTMIGGKWTTYRKMGEDLVNRAEKERGWKRIETKTKHLQIHGYKKEVDHEDPMYFYGTDREKILNLANENPALDEYVSEKLKIKKAQIVWAIRHEMALTVEDFLARRVRVQLLDARESMNVAHAVAGVMAKELGKDDGWIKKQTENYKKVTSEYLLN
jgi:glycerol-3-phosphate dehydrogenase